MTNTRWPASAVSPVTLLTSLALMLACALSASAAPAPDAAQIAAWREQAARVVIQRDDWGIPHVSAPTDADAVFGLMYAQAEDDFNRVETNFLLSLGRLAEAEGESEIWRDLRMKLFIDPEQLRALYTQSPPFLQRLMDAWADGLNYFLHTHPQVQPRVIKHFEPWMALSFSEGSIGGDIERVDLGELEAFYGSTPIPTETLRPAPAGSAAAIHGDGRYRSDAVRTGDDHAPEAGMPGAAPRWVPAAPGNTSAIRLAASAAESAGDPGEPAGSNGIAIAPRLTGNDAALLLINPHTSFFFRHEAQVTSDEGLNAYGALTWGQFFVYQGFNETAGWMHTSSSVDNIDEFAEVIVRDGDALFYRYADELRPVEVRRIDVPFRTAHGMRTRTFTTWRTHHGPIVRGLADRWVAVALMEEPMRALMQSFLRTKAADLADYVEIMRMHTNSSNNTVFADAEGNIAYLHSNFVPVRNPALDYRRPVDGSDPATDWQGLHTFESSPNTINPPSGWVQNTNNWPYSAAGWNTLRPQDYPPYMDIGSENPRGVHAIALLEKVEKTSLEGLRNIAFDSHLPAFDRLLPVLFGAWDGLALQDPARETLAAPIELLRAWDRRWHVDSGATSVAVFWATALYRTARPAAREAGVDVLDWMAGHMPPAVLLETLDASFRRLTEQFGDWRTPWGQINRFQRLTGEISPPYNDEAPSTPVGFVSGRWGSLASFGASPKPGTDRWYGTGGNSFVAVVEFAERVRAIAVTAGGLASDPASEHFDDQTQRYATGDLRPVYFWPEELAGHVERRYHPGE